MAAHIKPYAFPERAQKQLASSPMDQHNPSSTPAEISYDPGAAVATIRYDGTVTSAALETAQEAMIEQLAGRPVLGLVIDARSSKPAYSPAELIEVLECGMTELALERLAVLAKADRDRLIMLLETVAFGHGVRVRAFDDPREALRFASGV